MNISINPFRWPRWLRLLFFATIVLIMLFLLRYPLLRAAGNSLRVPEDTTPSDAIVVLGGNSYDRGLHGADLYRQHRAPRVVCTGGNIIAIFSAVDTTLFEAQVTRAILSKNNVPDSVITVLTSATSTREEAIEIGKWCSENGIRSLTIVSNVFHLKRVKSVFEEHCRGITLRYSEAPSTRYNPDEWWTSEEGLIMVNNEWMKRIYYWLRSE